MIICPECGEKNPQGSKFCRKCGINLVHEEHETEQKKEYVNAEKVTVEIDEEPVRTTVNTNSSNNKKDDDNTLCWGCCICMFFLFIIFAIFGH